MVNWGSANRHKAVIWVISGHVVPNSPMGNGKGISVTSVRMILNYMDTDFAYYEMQ